MKSIFNKVIILLCVLFCLSQIGAEKVEAKGLYIKNITTNQKTLTKGESFTLKTNIKASKCKFTSSKKSVVTISSKGKIKTKKVGKTTITVYSKSNKKVKTKVKVIVKKKSENEVVTTKWNDQLQQDVYDYAFSQSAGSSNCTDPTSQRYQLSREHLSFLQDLGNQWSEGMISKNTMWKKMTTTKFKLVETDKNPYWYIDDSLEHKVQTIQFKKTPTEKEVIDLVAFKQNVSAWNFFYFRYNNQTKTAYVVNAKVCVF